MLAEDGGPGAVEEPSAFLAEVSPGVEEGAGLVIANGEHATSIAPPAGLARLFAGPSNVGNDDTSVAAGHPVGPSAELEHRGRSAARRRGAAASGPARRRPCRI